MLTTRPVMPAAKWGAVSLARHAALVQHDIYLHVWHDGVDVTSRCTYADDTGEGYAVLLVLNADGKPYINRQTGHVARVMVTNIAIVAGAPFTQQESFDATK